MYQKKKNLNINFFKKKNVALNHWVVQKISAIILLPLLCWFLYTLKDLITKDYSKKILWMQDFSNSFLLGLFLLVALFHLRLGLSVVVEDYIHNTRSKKFLLAFIQILCLLLAVYTVLVIFILSINNNVK